MIGKSRFWAWAVSRIEATSSFAELIIRKAMFLLSHSVRRSRN
jgi:hypothetical protein